MTCTEHFLSIFAYFLVGMICMILVRFGLDRVRCRCFVRCEMAEKITEEKCCESMHEFTWGVLLWPIVFPAALGLFLIRLIGLLWMRHSKRSRFHAIHEGQDRVHRTKGDRA